jgi:hypothetical protein
MTDVAKIQKLALPALILITPFLLFLNYNSYCLACAETGLALGGIVLVAVICSVVLLVGSGIASALVMSALITGFIDAQFSTHLRGWVLEWLTFLFFTAMQSFVLCFFLKEKFYTIATAVFSTFFAVTVFQLALSSDKSDSFFGHRPEPAVGDPPRIIHLILDEHIGIEGIPTDIEGGLETKNLITNFYLKNGFQLFGGAFSRYHLTHASMGSMLNFTPESTKLITGKGPYTLLRNRYFDLLSKRRYTVEVLSQGWLDYCSRFKVIVTRCVQKDWSRLGHFSNLGLPTSEKLQVLYTRYLNQSTIAAVIMAVFVGPLKPNYSASMHHLLWALDRERTRTDSLNTLMDLKLLWKDISSLPRGRALFAHLMFPHYPYVTLPDCSVRPPKQWERNGIFDNPSNTVVSRKQRYQQYFEQLQCVYGKSGELFDRMRAAGTFDNSIILLHGDHGSRILMTPPTPANQQTITERDLADGFSSLFAMKLPGKPATYDTSPWPLEQLLAKFVFEAGLTPDRRLPEKTEPFVYLTSIGGTRSVRVPYVPSH